jgi:hypothetical protein
MFHLLLLCARWSFSTVSLGLVFRQVTDTTYMPARDPRGEAGRLALVPAVLVHGFIFLSILVLVVRLIIGGLSAVGGFARS